MRMFVLILSFIFLAIISVWAYNINYKTRSTIKSVNELSSQIKGQQTRLRLLKAEWAYLNRPDRLNKLITMHFSELELIALSHQNYYLFDKLVLESRRGIKNFYSDFTIESDTNSQKEEASE